MIRVTCYNCEDGITEDHDCGEDTCCSLNPYPNVRCDVCDGKGYWLLQSTDENFKKLAESDLEYEYDEVEARPMQKANPSPEG